MPQNIGKNVKATVKGNKLTLEIDLDQEFGPSSSGKTIIVASSEGNQTVGKNSQGAEIKLGINLYRKP